MKQQDLVEVEIFNRQMEDSFPAGDQEVLNVGIVGCGRMGSRRARIVHNSDSENLRVLADINLDRLNGLAEELECQSVTNWRDVIEDDDIDVVIVCVPNKHMAPVIVAALEAGKHVLCEKPPGRNQKEARQIVEAAERAEGTFKIGFDKRYHPAMQKMRELFDQDLIGPVMYGRAVFGHGASPGLEKTWFASADLAGGGAMIDMGVHLVDLLRWFMGDFKNVLGVAKTYYWDLDYFDSGQQVDDNAFFLMQTDEGQAAQVHVSWTQWKNRFSFEIFGRDGFLRMEGLGGYYGPSTLTLARRRPESGPPELELFEFNEQFNTLEMEWQDFVESVRKGERDIAKARDGLKTMRTIDALYRSASSGETEDI
jgi:predicted dehydrogenase